MSDEEALLKAIIAHPGDDTTKLVYADWLDEHDQPTKAAVVRAESWKDAWAIDPTPFAKLKADFGRVRDTANFTDYGHAFRHHWLEPGPSDGRAAQVGWSHGFVEALRANWRTVFACLPALVRHNPVDVVSIAGMSFLGNPRDPLATHGRVPRIELSNTSDGPWVAVAKHVRATLGRKPDVDNGTWRVWVFDDEKQAQAAFSVGLIAWARYESGKEDKRAKN